MQGFAVELAEMLLKAGAIAFGVTAFGLVIFDEVFTAVILFSKLFETSLAGTTLGTDFLLSILAISILFG